MKWWLITQCAVLKLLGLGLVFATSWDLLGWGIFFLGGGCVVAHHFLPRSQGLCDVVTGFIPEGQQVWLTIDDGPHPEDTPRILDLLDQWGAKATFFMIGERAALYPELVKAVLARGHSVGTHTQTHPLKDFWCAGRARVERELDDSLQVLQAAGGEVRLYRSPVGIKNIFLRRSLQQKGLRCIAWTVRSGDGTGHSLETIVDRVSAQAQAGSIVLMHEGERVATAVRVLAIEAVLRKLYESGFQCVLPKENALI